MKQVDLRGTRCPLTLLKMKQCLYSSSLECISFLFDDQGAAQDLPLYLKRESLWECVIECQEDYFEARCMKKSTITQ